MLRVVAISIVSGCVNDMVRRYLPAVALMTAAWCHRCWQCGGQHGLRRKWTEKNFGVVICHHNTPEFFKVPPDMQVSTYAPTHQPTLTDHTPSIAIAVDQQQVSTLWGQHGYPVRNRAVAQVSQKHWENHSEVPHPSFCPMTASAPSLSPSFALWWQWWLPAPSMLTSVEHKFFYFIYYSFFSNTPTWPSHLASPDHLQSQPGPTTQWQWPAPAPAADPEQADPNSPVMVISDELKGQLAQRSWPWHLTKLAVTSQHLLVQPG